MATTADLLAEAQTAYHNLMTGQQVVSFKDGDGTLVTYNVASSDKLADYIVSLGGADPRKVAGSRICGPMRALF